MSAQLGAIAELVLAAAIWGFGFIAAIWSLETLGPLWITALRFFIAGVASILFLLLFQLRSGHLHKKAFLISFKNSMLPGFLLSATLILQTWGLKYTSATRSGFITSLYVMFVPAMEIIFLRKKLSALFWFSIAGGLVGMSLMTGLGAEGQLNIGDLLTLGCALAAAVHILVIARVGHRVESAILFNTVQSIWAFAFSMTYALLFEPLGDKIWTSHSIVGLFSLGVGSTALAFYLQVRAQRVLSAAAASLLFLLEAPFSALFSLLILDEVMGFNQSLGAIVILASTVFAVTVEIQSQNRLRAQKAV